MDKKNYQGWRYVMIKGAIKNKRQIKAGRKYLQLTYQKGLVLRIYKEVSNLSSKETSTQF